MRCPRCIAAGQESTVTEMGRSRTALFCPPFYDKGGMRHEHDSNRVTMRLRCSNGHDFSESTGGSCWCGWRWDKK